MNTIVSFELAKMLKEKGFISKKCMGYAYFQNTRKYELMSHREAKDFAAPTIDEVKWWLYEKHGIWISVKLSSGLFWWEVMNNEKKLSPLGSNSYSPTEAYKSAIKYVLTNLI